MNTQQNGLMQQAAQQPMEQQERMEPQQDVEPQHGMQDNDGDSDDQQGGGDIQKVVLAAMDMLYSDKMRASSVKMLKGGKPVVTIPTLAAKLVAIVDEKSGGNMPEDIVIPAAMEILDEVREFAEKADIAYPEEEEDNAIMVMVQDLMESFGVTKEQVQEFIDQPEVNQHLQQVARGAA
ncbi:MAG: hypothetical protein R8K20_11995 [Gallionellaceae bacterium]